MKLLDTNANGKLEFGEIKSMIDEFTKDKPVDKRP